jgi:hypothetical protein
MLNYQLFLKLKLIERSKFNHLTIILTILMYRESIVGRENTKRQVHIKQLQKLQLEHDVHLLAVSLIKTMIGQSSECRKRTTCTHEHHRKIIMLAMTFINEMRKEEN